MSQNFLHTQHGTKLFLGLLAWFAVSVTLRCFFVAIYLEPWFFFFTLTTMSQNFLHTQHGTKLFVFLGLLAWFAVSVTLRRFFFANLLGTMVFLFHADNNVSNFLDTQHRTAPRGLFRFCCERCGSQVFALCTT